jgi:DNA-binding CsgD family transcriptional regulator
MSLVERGRELAHLEGVFVRSLGGRCQIVSIRGFAGAGKSELLHAFTEKAVREGALVLSAIAASAERAVPLGVLHQLLAAASTPLAGGTTLSRYLDQGTGTDPALAMPGPPSRGTLTQLMRELHGELARLARSHPLVIAVDDAQHADPASLECLLYIIRRLRQASVLVVLTESAHSRWPDPLVHAELVRQPGYRTIRLAALSDRGVHRVLADDLGGPVGAELAAAHHRATGGNPLLLRALLDDRRAAPGPAADGTGGVVAGTAFCSSVVACVRRSGPELTAVARALAVLDRPGEPALLGQLTGLGRPAVAQALHALGELGILDGGRFRHGTARLAVLGDVPAAERADLHRRAAGGLSGTDGPGAGVRPGPGSAAEPVTGPAAPVPAAVASAGSAGALAWSLLWQGRLDEAVEVLQRLAAGTGAGIAPDAAGAGGAGLADLRDWLRLTFPALAGHLPEPPGARPPTPPAAAGLLLQVLGHGGDEDSAEMAESLLRRIRLGADAVDAAEAALLALACADRPDRAAVWCDRLLADAAIGTAPTGRARLSAVRAEIALRQGDLRAARKHGDAALTRPVPTGWGVAGAGLTATLVLAETLTGDLAGAAGRLDRMLPPGALASRYGLGYLHARGWHHLEANRAQEALADFLACGDRARRWDMDLPALVPWRSGAALAHLRLGAAGPARTLAEEQLARPGGDRPGTRGSTLVVLARASEPHQRLQLLHEAVGELQGTGNRLEQARALAALSRAYRTLGEHGRAGTVASRARQLAQECGAEPLRRALGRHLEVRQVPDPRRASATPVPTVLSEAERRVAALASRGHTNREIAATLYITVSTVEQHLTRVYRKLNVTRRTDLSERLIPAS